MDEMKFDFLLHLFKTGEVFNKSLLLLEKQPDDIQARQAVSAAMQAMRSNYDSEPFRALAQAISKSSGVSAKNLAPLRKSFFLQCKADVYNGILSLLKDEEHIDAETADQLFAMIDSDEDRSSEWGNFCFNVSLRSSVSRPMAAFQHIMNLFELSPGMLSGEDAAHPGYCYRPSEQRTFDNCPICKGEGAPYFNAFSYRMANFSYPHLPAKLWMRCSRCGNLYTWKYPEEQLSLSKSFSEVHPERGKVLTTVQRTNGGILSIWSDIINRLQTYTSSKELLEVGVGTGELLAVALEMGFDVDAVELEPEAAQRIANLLGIDVYAGDFLNYAPEKQYAIISMGDVIEHVTDPGRALKNAHSLLKDDGVLWLSTPNFESSFSRMMKFTDPMWLEPYHITYFSYRGLKQLAEECGFEVCEYKVSNRYNGSMELILRKC